MATKRVLITGAAGFIGSHVLRYFASAHPYWEFVIVDRLNYAGALSRIADVVQPETRSRFKIVLHDLRAEITDYVRESIGAIDIVMHLAAETSVDKSAVDPRAFVESNVVGTFNLLEYCRLHQPRLDKFFLISTDEVYGAAPAGVDHGEDFPHRPSNVYAATKAAAEDLAFAYEHSMGVPVIITNTMNNIGPMQAPEKYLPRVIRALARGELITVHGTPDNVGTRKYLHARDHADAINFLMAHGKRGERYNVVGAEEVSNLDVVRRVEKTFRQLGHNVDAKIKFQDFHLGRPGHDRRYSLDGSKMAALGWVPSRSFDTVIHELVQWALVNKDWSGV